jgi:twitching motility two-component system response regulator PilH
MAREKILVVDDSPADLKLVTVPLQTKVYTVVTAMDGDEALAKAATEQPDLIVLDVALPKKNGFQVCQQLKTSPNTRGIKIILLTSKNQASAQFWGMKQGADGYLTKPFADQELLANVGQLL